MRQKLKTFIIALSLLSPLFLVGSATATNSSGCAAGETTCITAADCASGKTMVQTIKTTKPYKKQTVCAPLGSDSVNPIWGYLQTIVNTLSAGVGLVVVGTIIVGGVQYIVAGDNSGGVEQAKKRIISGLVALVGFFFAWSILQWLIPGGVFG